MGEFLLYINILKSIIDTEYERETVFYENGKWWPRDHCRYISPEVLTDWVLEIVNSKFCDES